MLTAKVSLITCSVVVLILLLSDNHQVEGATIKVAWLCTRAPVFIGFSASTNIGALSYSLETILNNSSLLPGYDFELRYADSACRSKNALGSLVDLIQSGYVPDVVVGPLCSSALLSSGLLGSHLNIPTFGWISSDPSVQDKKQYTTLVRLLWPVLSIGEGIVLLMQQFGWKKVFLISTVGGDYGELARGVRDVLISKASEGFSTTFWERDVPLAPEQSKISDIYQQVKQEARIVILSVPESEIRSWMLGVYTENMYNGEYVFIYINQQTPDASLVTKLTSKSFWQQNDGNDQNVLKAYENLFMLFARMNDFDQVDQFLDTFNTSAWTTSWASNISLTPSNPDFYSMFMYDTMMLYARIATEVTSSGGSISDGSAMFSRAQLSLTKGGATGDIIMDNNADRIPNYWLFDMLATETFGIIAETVSSDQSGSIVRTWQFSQQPRWGDGQSGISNAPTDEPTCGFNNEKCPPTATYIAVGVTIGVLILIIIIAFFVWRKISYERELKDMVWRVNYENVTTYGGMMQPGFGSMANIKHNQSTATGFQSSKRSDDNSLDGQKHANLANYKGAIVAVKEVRKTKIEINRQLLLEMKQMMAMKNNNLNVFIGACIDAPNISVFWEYCSKGSLQDVIGNENISLGEMFKFSIAIDILKGLQYIHESDFIFHSHLKSSNILVDGRWMGKITDFGLHLFIQGQEEDTEISDYKKYSNLYWTAPEILKDQYSQQEVNNKSSHIGSQPGDIYSVGIILKELFCRNEPYEEQEDDYSSQEIIEKVRDEEDFRPSLKDIEALESEKTLKRLQEFIVLCWSADSKERPSVQQALKSCIKINPFKKSNVLDNMLGMMEQYSAELENKVAEETETLRVEKDKTDMLLSKMLPSSVVEDLRQGKTVEAVSFDQVTIYFSDIPGFADFASKSTPVQVVDLLNSVYSLMDGIISQYDVYKVETVGDVYVLVSGLPKRNGDSHIAHIADCALDLLSGIISLKIASIPNYSVQLRIGVHTGPIVAGVIGLAMPRYCLFGDTINTSSRMESTGATLRIHLSKSAYDALSIYSGYHLADRGKIPVKGKGEMNTFWLIGRDDFSKQLPAFNKMFEKDSTKPTILPPTTGKSILKKAAGNKKQPSNNNNEVSLSGDKPNSINKDNKGLDKDKGDNDNIDSSSPQGEETDLKVVT